MHPFSFYNPVTIHFGVQAMDNLSQELAKYGEKMLVVYGGGSIKRNGVYDDVMKVLKETNKEVYELAGVEPNPRLETARKGAALCKEHKIDFVLAVGGGSVIDCSKLIAAAAKYDGDAWDFVTLKAQPEDAIPLGVVLTLAATGSEMNAGSVITNAEIEEKHGWGHPLIFPKFSILNPAYTLTVPKDHTIYGIVDMMSHIFEQYFHDATNTAVMDGMCEGVLRAIIEAAPALVNDLENIELRETILLAGTIGLNNFLSMGSNGDWATHDIEHAVSAVYDIPHAGGLAILQPHWMRHVMSENPARFARLAVRVFDVETEGKTDEQVAMEGIDRLAQFWTSLGAPTRLADYDIDDRHFDKMVTHAMTNGPFGSFKKLQAEDVRAILQSAL